MSLDIKRMQKLAGILTEGFMPEEEMQETYTKSSLKAKIKEMILKEMETPEDELEEAKKTEEEVPAEEEMPAEEAPSTTGGLEDISADMEGTEGDLMDHLMSAFKIAKGMGNEKLETQVGNTLKFFVSEYIGGGEG